MIKKQRKDDQTAVTFVLSQDEVPGKVSVVGDFNDWTPGVHTLVRRANGTRSVKVTVPAGGSYAFRYLSESGEWFNDADAEHHDWQNGLVLT